MVAAKVSIVSNALFVGLLATLHVLKPEVDPSWRFISEYAIGNYGWIMQAAFLSLAVANVAIVVAVRDCLQTRWSKVGAGLFLAGAAGVVLAAIFVTDPVNTPSDERTTSGNLHNLGGALGLLGFVGNLMLSARLLRSESWRAARLAVGTATGVVVLGFLISFLSITVIAARHQGVFSPETPVGWPNRVGILSGCAWLAVIAILANRARSAVASMESD